MSNVGSVDRIVRIVAGLLLIAFAIPIGFPQTGWNWVGWIGVVPLLTAVFCLLPGLRAVRHVHLSRQIRREICNRCASSA
jgi:hypothetical protein